MRRSTREVKKPEIFRFEERLNKSRDLDNDDDNASPETDEEEDLFLEKNSALIKNRPTKSKAASKRSITSTSVASSSSSSSGATSLFETVRSSKKLQLDVDMWIESYTDDRITAVVDLVNFILMAAGAKRQWIPADVDLDALEPEELDELLSDMTTEMINSEGSKLYPLNTTSKQSKVPSFRDRYVMFWTLLSETLQSSEDQYVASKAGMSMLKVITDQLVSLSSMAVVNVRDAVTEASLTVGQRAVACCVGLAARCESSRRQLQAEVNKKIPGLNSRQTPKYIAISKQSTRLREALDGMEELCGNIFNSVFVHRLKDSQDAVRALCTRHIGDWLPLDPAKYYKDDYLKYIGWMCFDYSAAVRKEAIRSIGRLLKADTHTGALNGFVERFIGRFVEIAVGDVDDTVALEMMAVMRDLQMKGMLDQVDEESLDLVDEVIFDGGACKRVRQEALAFMMDHTEGFEDEEENASTDVSTSNHEKGKKKSKEDASMALAKRQKTATQLETLTEFAEHHLCSESTRCALTMDSSSGSKVPDLGRIEMLVEACLLLPQGDIMRDWSTMIALLLRESDDLISTALRPSLSAILLRIFVASALNLRSWFQQTKAAQNEEIDGMRGGKPRKSFFANRLDGDDTVKAEQYESLNSHLLRDLPTLLTRFRDDQTNLSVLVSLLCCCDVSVSNKALKSLLKSVVNFFESSSEIKVIDALCRALREWMMMGGTAKGAVDASVTALLSSLWGTIDGHLQTLKGASATLTALASEMALDGNSKNARKQKQPRKSSLDERALIEETVLSASVSVMKYKSLWMTLDCRPLSDLALDDIADQFVEIADVTVSLCEEQGYSGELERSCATMACDASHVLQSIVIWPTHDVYKKCKELFDSAEDGNDAAGSPVEDTEGAVATAEEDEELVAATDTVLRLREKLVDVLQTWMALGDQEDEDAEGFGSLFNPSNAVDGIHRMLQREAFSMIGTLRTLYPVCQQQYQHVSVLAFTPSQDILAGLRKVFELEGGRIKMRIKQCSDVISRGTGHVAAAATTAVAAAEVESLTTMLVESLLLPLRDSMIFDVANLNRRQAAAVLCYYLEPSPLVQEAIKGLIKCLKEADIVKYLEVQMVALKGVYAENVVARLVDKQQMEEEEGLDNYLAAEREASNALAAGYSVTVSLSKKLVATMGVGKAKGTALSATVNFFKAGIDVCLSQASHMGFVCVLEQYLRLLPPLNVKVVGDYFEMKVDASADMSSALQDNDAHGDRELQALIDFRSLLNGKGKKRRESGLESDVSSQGSSPGTATASRGRAKAGDNEREKQTGVKRKGPAAWKAMQAKTKKRHPSMLESVHEDGEGSDEDEEGGSEDDDPDAPARRQPSKKRNSLKPKAVAKRSSAEHVPAPEGSRRSSRGQSTKPISYTDGAEEEEEEDEEENEGEEEEEVDEVPSSRMSLNVKNTKGRNSSTTSSSVIDKGTALTQASKGKGKGKGNISQQLKGRSKNANSDEEEAREEEDEEEEEDATPPAFSPIKASSTKAAPVVKAVYGGASKIKNIVKQRASTSSDIEDSPKRGKAVMEEVEESNSVSSIDRHKSTAALSSSNRLVSRTDTVHLGLELEDSTDWVGSQEEKADEEDAAILGDDFYSDANYTRKRDRDRDSRESTVMNTDRDVKSKQPKDNDPKKKAKIVAVPTRTSVRNASSQSQSQSQSTVDSLLEEPAPAKQTRRKAEQQIDEVVIAPTEDQEPDIFAGLTVPSRKRYR